MNDEINAAREVTKTNTLRVETFRAPDLGLLGYVDEDKVTFYRASTRRHTVNTEFDVGQTPQLPKVEIVTHLRCRGRRSLVRSLTAASGALCSLVLAQAACQATTSRPSVRSRSHPGRSLCVPVVLAVVVSSAVTSMTG